MPRTRPGLGAGAARTFPQRPDTSDPSDPQTPPAPARASFVQALRGSEGDRLIEVPIDLRLVDNPGNPRVQLTNIDELADSIRGSGLLQPIVVTPAAAFQQAHPGVDLPGDAEWVLAAGHRRRAAGVKAGLATLPGIVRSTVPEPTDAMVAALAENVQREDLTPLEEARAFSILTDMGMSQRDINRQTGISQSHVSKRLRLLEFPQPVQDAIDQRQITVIEALTVLRDLRFAEDQTRAVQIALDEQIPLSTAVRRVARPITGPDETSATEQDSSGPAEPTAAPGTDAGDPGTGETTADLFLDPPATPGPADGGADPTRDVPRPKSTPAPDATTGDPFDPEPNSSSSAGEDPGPVEPAVGPDDAVEEHNRAALARARACRLACRGTLNNREINDVLVDMTLFTPTARPGKALETALSWLNVDAQGDPESILERLADAEKKTAQKVAVAAALARRESDLSQARYAREPWTPAMRRHVRRLVDWGAHETGPFELRKLAEAEAEAETNGAE